MSSAKAKPKKTPKTARFRLENLFGSQTRARLLALFAQNPEKQFFVRELTRKIDAQLNSVRRELQNLIAIGFVQEVDPSLLDPEVSVSERKKYYAVDQNFYLFTEIKELITKAQLLIKKSLISEITDKGNIDYLILTGQFVNEESPTDILVVGDISPKMLQKMVKKFEAELGVEINYTLMPRDEYLYRKEVTDRFLYSILEGEKLVVVDNFS